MHSKVVAQNAANLCLRRCIPAQQLRGTVALHGSGEAGDEFEAALSDAAHARKLAPQPAAVLAPESMLGWAPPTWDPTPLPP